MIKKNKQLTILCIVLTIIIVLSHSITSPNIKNAV